METRHYRKHRLLIWSTAMAITATIVCLLGIESHKVSCIDLGTMRIQEECWLEFYGLRWETSRNSRRTLLSAELARIRHTTGLKGTLQMRREWTIVRMDLPPVQTASSHSLGGSRVRDIAFSFRVARFVRLKGTQSLTYLRNIIGKARDPNVYPNWQLHVPEEGRGGLGVAPWNTK